MATRIVHCKKAPYDIYIGRGTPFGNKYKIGPDGSRKDVIKKFKQDLLNKPKLIERMRKELKDKTLGCWCKPDDCHGDVIIELIDERKELSGRVQEQFLASWDKQTICAIDGPTCKGIDLDAFHRKFRLMAKAGLMMATERGEMYCYTITPAGLAYRDYVTLKWPSLQSQDLAN